MHVFKLKDRVQWKSGAHGVTKEKHGEVILVVRPHEDIGIAIHNGLMFKEGDEEFSTAAVERAGRGSRGFRTEETYVVAVSGGPRAKRKLYWPRANSLRPWSTQERPNKEKE